MKRKQFSEEQIIGLLKEAEAGAVVTELSRKQGAWASGQWVGLEVGVDIDLTATRISKATDASAL